MDCLVKKECKNDDACVKECFQTDKAKSDLVEIFIKCNSGRCNKDGGVSGSTGDWTKYYECLPKCYNNVIGKPSGTEVDLNAKASDKKDDDKKEGDKKDDDKKEDGNNAAANNTTATKPSAAAPAANNNAFKAIPSVVAAFILAVLAL
jgi:hypothetical protein